MADTLAGNQLDPDHTRALAGSLHRAYRTHQAIAPLTDAAPELGLAEGYAIQQELVRLLEAEGEVVVGYKVGLTSSAMQTMLGVDQPDFGPLFASGFHESPAAVSVSTFIAPRIEAEIGVLLNQDLSGPNCSVSDVRGATSGVVAALEVVDSRIRDWKIKLADTVADLASGGAFVRSAVVVPIHGWEPRLTGVVFAKNGETLATSAGAAALGDPLGVVAWLANTLSSAGVRLRAGQIVMTGALHAMVPIEAGDHIVAEFDRLGRVEATAQP
jgi:2-keto-4-pentenoate hydratase